MVSVAIHSIGSAHPDRASSATIRFLENKATLSHALVYFRYRSSIKEGIVAIDERFWGGFAMHLCPTALDSCSW